jgi:MFS family permease
VEKRIIKPRPLLSFSVLDFVSDIIQSLSNTGFLENISPIMAVGARANAYSFAVTFFSALGSFTYGYNAAIMGSVIGLPAFFKYYNIDYASSEGSSITGAINGVFYGGGAIGCWTMPYLADYFGQRRCLQIICVVLSSRQLFKLVRFILLCFWLLGS